jgi:hypothetical protein
MSIMALNHGAGIDSAAVKDGTASLDAPSQVCSVALSFFKLGIPHLLGDLPVAPEANAIRNVKTSKTSQLEDPTRPTPR